ncbi:hypothetical protein [Actinomadura litoris]|uniref:hypothetical protein n=1 Tax=Actinomadura litoris TaxID=2678616 RepID=UPI001FA7FAB7|nr:hypothetical protein [Actinomadura litoris]
MAIVLTTTWMLVTGRRLHQYPALHCLDSEQLIEFWAEAADGTAPWKTRTSETTEDTRS